MRGAFQLFSRSQETIGFIKSVVVALLTVALIVNVYQFNMRTDLKRFYAVTYETADIIEIGKKKSRGVRSMYGMFFELGKRYPGSVVIFPRGLGADFKARLLSFGRASRLLAAKYESELVLSGLDYEPFVVVRGQYSDHPFVIAADSNPKSFVVLHQGKTILLDLSLLLRARRSLRD